MAVANNQKCERNKLIAIGTITSIVAVVSIYLINRYYFYLNDLTHVYLLAFLGSLSLVAGAIKQEHRLLYPWFLTTSLQIYAILFVSIIFAFRRYRNWDIYAELIGMYLNIGVGLFFLKDVYTQFKAMRKNYQVGGIEGLPTAVETIN